jgi:Tfp pilus assembly protein PilN
LNIRKTAYLYYFLELEIDYKEQTLKTMKAELVSIEKIIKEVKDLEKDKKIVEERIKVIAGLISNQTHLSRTLGEFSSAILNEVWVSSLSLSANQTFNFSANTFNNYLIAKYMVALKDDPNFDNIELAYVRKSKIIEADKEVEIVNFKMSGIFIP